MSTPRPTSEIDINELRKAADSLKARTRILASAMRMARGDIHRVDTHARLSGGHLASTRTRDNLVYSHGAVAERGGYLVDLDDLAIAGLEHHGQLYAYWMARAAAESPASNRGELLRYIFSDPDRHRWCRMEGVRLAWEYAKANREAETASFLKRQEKSSRDWRKRPMTVRQLHLITLICIRGDFAFPGVLKSGAAYDWIAKHGSHPDFWKPPNMSYPWPSDE